MKAFIQFLGVLFILSACTKQEPIGIDDTQRQLSLVPIAVPPISKKPIAGLYVSKFDSILGDTAKENNLLQWAKQAGFNQLYLYGVSSVITSASSRAKINTFIGKAKTSPYAFRISFVAASSASANNYYNLYYTSVLYPNKFDAINTEYEYWNSSYSYAGFTPLYNALQTINSLTTTPKVSRNVYLAQFSDAAAVATNVQIMTDMINGTDKMLLTNYHTSAGTVLSPLIVSKLNDLSIRANALGKIANVEILYNVRLGSSSPDIYNYFSTSGGNNFFITAYNNFLTNYAASSGITYKSNLRIIGYSIYRYQEAKLARP